jgi:hypothetical protein
MGIFVPYNIKALADKDSSTPTEFYFSLLLECPQNDRDNLHDIVVTDITLQPLVAPFKSMALATLINQDNEPKIKFFVFDPKQDSI